MPCVAGATEHPDVAPDASDFVVHVPPAGKVLFAVWPVVGKRRFVPDGGHRRRRVGGIGRRCRPLCECVRERQRKRDDSDQKFHTFLVVRDACCERAARTERARSVRDTVSTAGDGN
jgi:hypothetical protein